MTADAILTGLIELDRKVEEHKTALFSLKMQRATLRNNLAATSPETTYGECW